jgi:hypothetical protein
MRHLEDKCLAQSSLTLVLTTFCSKAFDLILTLSLRFTKVGLLIGPRGNTLKKMETESQAKIAIRGKGSVKEGKGRSDAAHTSNQEEDLHCLIMADTEEKVNKAKKLIHNIIETVSPSLLLSYLHETILTVLHRLHLSRKVRTSLSAINFVNLPLLTAPFVMMRIKPARTVVKLVTGNTTVPNNATLLPTSSVVFVAMLVTWLAIVRIDNAVPIGATIVQLVPQDKAVLVQVMMLTANMR